MNSQLIEYWKLYWKYFTDNLNGKEYDTNLNSPRFVIDDILSEIKYNDFKNKNNRILFKKQLGYWYNNEKIFKDIFNLDVQLALSHFDEFNNKYLLSICNNIKKHMDNGEYFNLIYEQLHELLNTKEINNQVKREINKYSQLLVAEYLVKEYCISDIQEIIEYIYYDYKIFNGNHKVFTKFPHPIKCDDFIDNGEINYNKYNKEVVSYIDSLKDEDRFAKLKYYYSKEKIKCYVLFQLKGLKGNSDIFIGDINLYSPKVKQYTGESSMSRIEEIEEGRDKILAAVPIDFIMIKSSIDEAAKKLEKVIDFLSISYNSEVPISFDKTFFDIVDVDKYSICGSIGKENIEQNAKHNEFIQYVESIDLDENKIDLYKKKEYFVFSREKNSHTEQQLLTSLHWYNKGKASSNFEDKLLYHWIAIESLLKIKKENNFNITGNNDSLVLDVIKKITSSILVKEYFYQYCSDTYINISINTNDNPRKYNIPQEIIKKAQLDMKGGDKIHIECFFKNIDEIKDSISDEIMKTKLTEIEEFYKDKEGVKNREKVICDDIILIYRVRNLIVHNAIYPKYLIQYYAHKVEFISGHIIRYILAMYKNSKTDIEDILIEKALDYDKFLLNIDIHLKNIKDGTK